MKTLIIPLDDRPVTYTFAALVARAARLEAILPPRHLMGSLARPAQIDELLNFAEHTIAKQEPNAVIVCLDSILYGGLISGRRSNDDIKTITSRLDRVKKWKSFSPRPPIVMAQSSIMRISDNYDNTEEKDYWSRFGREIFEWSACLHRLSRGEKPTAGLLEALERRIPADIRQDYLDTRKRNFSINMALLNSMSKSSGESLDNSNENSAYIDYLIFSQDDSGAYGLNVREKERLIATSAQLGLTDKVNVYAGADEVLMTLLARLLVAEGSYQNGGQGPQALVHFSPPSGAATASRYEGQDVRTTVSTQGAAAGLVLLDPNKAATAGSDTTQAFTLIIHGPVDRQGDHITLPGQSDLSTLDSTEAIATTIALIEKAKDRVIIADLAYANGGDPKLVEILLKRPELLARVKSYAGWNTSGNTMGSALALAIASWYFDLNWTVDQRGSPIKRGESAETVGKTQANGQIRPMSEWHKQCLFVRLVDDWAYQSCVRKKLDGEASTQKLATLIGPYIGQVNAALGIEPSVRLSFPWKRTFEIEIGFEGG